MTVATSTSKSGPYAGAGTTGPFTVTFRFLENSHLQVIKTSTAGIDSTLALTTDYAVSGAGASTGTVTLVSALMSGEKLTIIRNVPFTQEADYVQNDAFPAESHERALDKLTMETQQLKEAIDRSIKLPATSTEDVAALTADLIRVADSADNIDTVADNIASVNANAAAIAAIQTNAANITDIQNAEENAALVVNATSQAVDGEKDLFVAGVGYIKGTTTQLTLAYTPAKSGTVDVFFDGVFQHLTEWSLAGKVITFTAAIPADKVEVHYVIPSQFVGLSNADLLVLGEAEAAAQAGAASAQADAATATAAKTAAEAARDAANVSGRVYATTAAGIAATTNGQYFSIPSPENAEYLILYLNSSGTAVEKKRYPSTAALDFVKSQPVADGLPVFSVTDDTNNIAFEVTRSGGLRTKQFQVSDDGEIETTAVSTVLSPNPRYVYSVTDEAMNIIFAIDNLGQLVANFDLVPAPTQPAVETQGPLYDYSVNQIFGYGQSLSVGQAYPAISVSQSYDNLRFTRGMRPVYDYPAESAAQWYASLIPAVEENNASGYVGVLGETPSMGTADMIKERILAEDGKSYTQHQYQILISTPGYGATTISQLSKGGVHFARMVEQATYGKTLANAAGKSHAVQAVTWTQGESDYLSGTTQAAYVTALNSLIADINTDIKAVTGQTKSIPVIGYQISSHITYASDDFPDIALAQLEVEAANPLFYIACAMYQFSYHSGGHISNVSTRWLGGYYGLAYKRIVINGEDWMPLKPIASVRQSNFVEIRFHVPDGPLVFDTSQVSAQTNYGFQLLDSAGVAITITSVAIIDTDRVRITASTAIPSGAKARYAFTGDSVTGKGNLRDSQGDTITFAIPGSTAKRMDNWCLIFELAI